MPLSSPLHIKIINAAFRAACPLNQQIPAPLRTAETRLKETPRREQRCLPACLLWEAKPGQCHLLPAQRGKQRSREGDIPSLGLALDVSTERKRKG